MQFHYEDEEKVVKCEKSQRYIFETLKSIYVLEFSRETDRMYIYNIYDIDRYRDWKENVCGGEDRDRERERGLGPRKKDEENHDWEACFTTLA